MDDLISRAALLEKLDVTMRITAPYDYRLRIPEAIEKLPAVDAVPVVRCGGCKNWETDWKPNHSIDGEHFCPMILLVTSGEWFCAYGERMDSNGTDA